MNKAKISAKKIYDWYDAIRMNGSVQATAREAGKSPGMP
jgi:hypothetical protein